MHLHVVTRGSRRSPLAMICSRVATSETSLEHTLGVEQRLAAQHLKLYLQPSIKASTEVRKAQHFGVLFVEQIFDAAG